MAPVFYPPWIVIRSVVSVDQYRLPLPQEGAGVGLRSEDLQLGDYTKLDEDGSEMLGMRVEIWYVEKHSYTNRTL